MFVCSVCHKPKNTQYAYLGNSLNKICTDCIAKGELEKYQKVAARTRAGKPAGYQPPAFVINLPAIIG